MGNMMKRGGMIMKQICVTALELFRNFIDRELSVI